MIIRPRKHKYEKHFRNKKNKIYKAKKLVFGTSGIKTLSKLVLTTRQLNKYIIFIKKYIRKMEKTQKRFWFIYSFSNNLTTKPKGSRMGKGKGKPYIWSIAIFSGVWVFEFRNVRFGKGRMLLKKFKILLNTVLKYKHSRIKILSKRIR